MSNNTPMSWEEAKEATAKDFKLKNAALFWDSAEREEDIFMDTIYKQAAHKQAADLWATSREQAAAAKAYVEAVEKCRKYARLDLGDDREQVNEYLATDELRNEFGITVSNQAFDEVLELNPYKQ